LIENASAREPESQVKARRATRIDSVRITRGVAVVEYWPPIGRPITLGKIDGHWLVEAYEKDF
jgi:hypothetical protein